MVRRPRPGHDLLLADDADELADVVGGLLADAGRRVAMGEAGRRAVEERYDARRVYGALDEVYRPVLAAPPTVV